MSSVPISNLAQKKRRPMSTLTNGRFKESWLSPLVLLPSLAAITIFVYVFIGFSFWVSLSNWRTLKQDMTIRDPLFATYGEMMRMPRFQADLRNTLIFTLIFITLAIVVGLGLAILLERKIVAKPFFRNVILFPYALSFVVTGWHGAGFLTLKLASIFSSTFLASTIYWPLAGWSRLRPAGRPIPTYGCQSMTFLCA